MNWEEHYRKLENMYLGANVNQNLYETTKILIQKETAEISLQISEKYFHALGAMHGSVYFRLLDDAAFFAVNSVVTDAFVLTTSFNLNLIRPVNSGTVTAKGKVRFSSKNMWTAESTLFNEAGKEVAFGTGNFSKSKVALTPEIGYR